MKADEEPPLVVVVVVVVATKSGPAKICTPPTVVSVVSILPLESVVMARTPSSSHAEPRPFVPVPVKVLRNDPEES